MEHTLTTNKNKILLIGLLLFSFCGQSQKVGNPTNSIYGKWKCAKYLRDGLGKYTITQVESIKKNSLQIKKGKIYFEQIKFIDTCKFSLSEIKYSKLLDKGNWEYSWYEDGDKLLLRPKDTGLLPFRYSKVELSKIDLIELGCDSEISRLYLKQDTLILSITGGIVLMTKVTENK